MVAFDGNELAVSNTGSTTAYSIIAESFRSASGVNVKSFL